MEIVKLRASDYDECLKVLNVTFTKQNKKLMDFEKELPKTVIEYDNFLASVLPLPLSWNTLDRV